MLASATAAGQLIVVLASPILTRLYRPEEFGVFAVFSALLGLIAVASSLRYELAIPIIRYQLGAFHLMTLAMAVNLAFSFLALLAAAVLRHPIAAWTKTPSLASYLWLLPVAVFLFGMVRALNYWAIRQQNYRQVAVTKVFQGVANVGIQISAGVAQYGAMGLIAGQICGQLAGMVSLARFALKTFPERARLSARRMRAVAARHRNFARFDTPASIIDTMSEQLPSVLFAVLFNPAVAGFFMLAQRTLSIPVSLLGQAVGQVLYGRCRQAIDDSRLDHIVRTTVFTLGGLAIVPTIVVAVWGEELFRIVFGASWQQSGRFASWLILASAAQFAYSPVSLVLLATGGQHVNLSIHSVLLITRLAGILWGWMRNDALLAVAGFTVCGFFGYLVGIFLVIRRAGEWSRRGNGRVPGLPAE